MEKIKIVIIGAGVRGRYTYGDFIKNSPYRKINFLQIFKISSQDKELHKFWNGKFDIK